MEYDGTACEVVNLVNNETFSSSDMVAGLEKALGVKAALHRLSNLPGDVHRTWADVEKPRRLLRYRPETKLPQGLNVFAEWLRGSGDHVGAG